MKRVQYGLFLTVILVSAALPSWGQVSNKRINFSINAPFSLRMGEYILPPGNYVLRQVLDNDLNLFALYPEDLTNEPIAMIRTTRIDYQATRPPENTKIFVELDEASPTNDPVIQGWTIPGLDGWEVISVVEKKSGRLRQAAGKEYKLDRKKMTFDNYDEKDRRSKIIFKRADP